MCSSDLGAVRTFDQGLAQCQRVLAEERAAARAAEVEAREKAAKKTEAEAPPSEPKKAIETGKVRNPKMFARLEERIMTLEAELEALRASMLDPANYASATKMKQLQGDEVRLKAEIAEAYTQWENWQ